ncbi:carbohydrate ABC transporter permease [Halogeometricum borinquense]|uniref:Carbohydrate ABC transporter permease n=1 Tax=Halogeometricum borinquense TaxID=60847 RepID=A0A6C0UK91_9EURY|nr:carbohydrate ABC transporter permease [Halogeometricum borinquense]QIB74741.1 carbohydrate ABC transporter permease [Halogeometricum borinquense]QIQ76304.1 carbohydrate ABC transporter permease [Halogeometricum borinquense]
MSLADDIRSASVSRYGLYVVIAVMAAFYLAPLESGLMTSIKTQDAFINTTPFIPPFGDGFTLGPWNEAWAQMQGPLTDFSGALYNSAFVAIPATVLSGLIGSIAAYGLTNLNWRGQAGVLILFVAGMFVPYQSVLVPLTRFWTIVGLHNHLAGIPFLAQRVGLIELIVTHTAYGIPICTILFRSYYASFDQSMLEAARIDGATFTRIYRRIIFPLSKPMFAVVLIYQFTQVWNDFLFALVLVSSPTSEVATIALNKLQGSMVQQYNIQMAAAFIAALPTLLVYVLFGDKFAEGVAGET